jgi:hypothetical protein
MNYMYLIYLNEEEWNWLPAAERQRCMAQGDWMVNRWKEQGKYRGGAPLHSATTATTIRFRDGKYVVSDGPFAETKEQLAGYMLVSAANRDEALAMWMDGNSGSPGTIEVRELAEFPQADGAVEPGLKQYMLLCYHSEARWETLSEAEQMRMYEDACVFAKETADKGKWIKGSPLQPTSEAKSVRGREGKLVVTDGPFAETKEQLAGFVLIQAENLDEAIALGKRFHAERVGAVEVRPVVVGPCDGSE